MKNLIAILVILVTTLSVDAQLNTEIKENKKFEKEKLYYGGDFLVSFGENSTLLLAPDVGYRFTESFSLGLGLNYRYHSTLDQVTQERIPTNSYGANAFARWELGKDLFLISDFERINIEQDFPNEDKNWTSFWLTGVGYQRSLGGEIKLNIQLLYDVLENPLTPHYYPSIPIGFPLYIRFGITSGI